MNRDLELSPWNSARKSLPTVDPRGTGDDLENLLFRIRRI